jgi:branched-chain amino acid transport system ATP-binding protein
VLDTKNLTVKFGSLVAVNNLNMHIEENSIHALIGPNGAGKTTVFNAIFNLVPYEGSISFLNKNLDHVPTFKRANLGLYRTFQNLNIFPSMTVEQNIEIGLHTVIKSNLLKDFLGFDAYSTSEVKQKVHKVTEMLGLTGILNAYPLFLPYGTQKLVELARVLIGDPKIILLDEPAAGLNTSEKENFKLIIQEARKTDITILLVEHDMGVVMDISDTVTVMDFGQKIAEGKPSEVEKNHDVIEAYLGV